METINELLKEITLSKPFLLAISVLAFYIAQLIHRRFNILLLHPIVVSSLIVIGILNVTGVEYEQYYRANEIINVTLNISVIALSYLMHKNINRLKEARLTLIISTFVGSIVGILSVVYLARLFNLDEVITLSLQPKSVTTPIALSLSQSIGGIPALTSLALVGAGILGSIVGPALMKICRITEPIARGAALGSASHAVGTARALELGAIEGAVGGAAICLMGLFTSILIPLLNTFGVI